MFSSLVIWCCFFKCLPNSFHPINSLNPTHSSEKKLSFCLSICIEFSNFIYFHCILLKFLSLTFSHWNEYLQFHVCFLLFSVWLIKKHFYIWSFLFIITKQASYCLWSLSSFKPCANGKKCPNCIKTNGFSIHIWSLYFILLTNYFYF